MIESLGAMALAVLDDPDRTGVDPGPAVLQVDPMTPGPDETWAHFKERVADRLGRLADLLDERIGVGVVRELYAGNALAVTLVAGQLAAVVDDPHIDIAFADLDPVRPVALHGEIASPRGIASAREIASARGSAGFEGVDGLAALTGAGVRVAVLDTGVDGSHPALRLAHSIETCGEPVDVPGGHGTHCAGVIASTDPTAPGLAPGVELINVKVLRTNGTGQHTAITAGVDRALDLSADILSISLGFNHLPAHVPGGHDWTCVDGTCPLCTAVDNAVIEGALVVAAAGNEHRRCERLRADGRGLLYDTELTCPGQARGALTVGAVHPATGAPATFSSNGPTAYGLVKPDLCGPGVDVRSTAPAVHPGSASFEVRSGTSMAAAAVAGACALLIESARRSGAPDDPDSIRRQLLATCVEPTGGPVNVVGAGRLRLPR